MSELSKWTLEPPHLNPEIGCLNCGGAEMIRGEGEILADMDTELYYDPMGGWTITLNGELYFQSSGHKDGPLLSRIEASASGRPDNDWRANYYGAMREATYQRQGENRWVLIASGPGFSWK